MGDSPRGNGVIQAWGQRRSGAKDIAPLNNNRGNNNNRRRGRGNNNRPQGNGQQVNRIDSRARGNAPQMLEKYRKQAQDAHLNGDRVTAEYYLQFADHYFRVIADARVRVEEQRARRDDRWQENGEPFREEPGDEGEFNMESDFPAFDQPPVYTRRDREDRPQREERQPERVQDRAPDRQPREERSQREERAQREDRPQRDDRPQREDRVQRDNRPRDDNRPPREPRPPRDVPVAEPVASEETGANGNVYEPPENPFIRDNRGPRTQRPRRDDERRPRREGRGEAADGMGQPVEAVETPMSPSDSIDSASLPPAISTPARRSRSAAAAAPAPAAPAPAAPAADAEEAKPRRRATRRKAGSTDETLESAA